MRPSNQSRKTTRRALSISGFGILSVLVTITYGLRVEPIRNALFGVIPPLLISVGFVALGAHIYHRQYDLQWVQLLQRWHLIGALTGGVLALVVIGYETSYGVRLIHPEFLLYYTVIGGAGIGVVVGYQNLKEQQRASQFQTSSAIFDTLREINRQLATAADRETLEHEVCATIADANTYTFAWIGKVEENKIVPRASAGAAEGYLDEITITVDGGAESEGPAGTAVRTRKPQILHDLSDSSFEPWQEAAQKQGFQSSMAVPLIHEDTCYGVLCIYADRPEAFIGREYEVLVELGDTITNAIDAVELRKSQTALLDGMADAAFVYSKTQDSLVDVNQAAVERLGYSREELLSMHPEDFDVSDVDCDAVGRHRQIQDEGKTVFETVHETKTGEELPVEINATQITYRGESAILAVARDICERKERERQLRSYREAIDHAGHAIYITKLDGTIEYVNPAFEDQTGYQQEEVIGKTPKLLNSGHHDDDFYEDLWQTILNGEVYHNEEMINERKDGTNYYVDQTIAPISDETGIERFVAVSQEITELKEHEEQLEEQTEQLELLNRLVRHDIRNDMTLVLGLGELLLEEVPESNRSDVKNILKTSRHTVELTRTVRDLTEMLRSGTDPERKPITLRQALLKEFKNTQRSYPDAKFNIDELPQISIQAGDLVPAIFRNLLHNAVQHNNKDEPQVNISAVDHDGSIVVKVADNGPGIPDERKDAIFGKGEKDLGSPGTGMGLYFVETLVDQYGGKVWVNDNAPEGSIFNVKLMKAKKRNAENFDTVETATFEDSHRS